MYYNKIHKFIESHTEVGKGWFKRLNNIKIFVKLRGNKIIIIHRDGCFLAIWMPASYIFPMTGETIGMNGSQCNFECSIIFYSLKGYSIKYEQIKNN